MGNIGDLNFQVILGGENEFRTKINKFKGMAEELNTSLTNALDLSKKAKVDPLKTYKKALDDISNSAKKATTAQGKFYSALEITNTKLSKSSDLLKTISQLSGVAFSVVGIRQFFSSLVDISGEFEVQKMALTSMLQSADKADEIFNTLRQDALRSPYTFQDLTKYAKQLTAFNIDSSQLIETERRLADVAAGLGVDVGRIILAYGQVKAAGVLKGTELRQFTEAGVPLLQNLAEQIKETEGNAISLAEVFQRISKKQIPFEMVEEAFRRMTSEGGKFYNMQEVLVNTLQGKVRKLKDTWQQSLYDMGQSTDSWLKFGVDAVTLLAANLDKLGFALKPIIAGFGAYAAALAILWVREKAIIAMKFAGALYKVATGANSAAAAMRLLGITSASAAGAIGLVVAAGVALVSLLASINGPIEKFEKELDKIHETAHDTSSYDAEIGRLNSLKKTLDDANGSYDERKRALAEIKSIVPDYHANLSKEGKLINDNRIALDKYIDSLKQEAKTAAYKEELSELYKKQAQATRERDDAQEAIDKYNERRNDYSTMPAMVPGVTNGRSPQFVEGQILNGQLDNAQGKLDLVNGRIDRINEELNRIDFKIPNDPTWGPNNPASGNSEIQRIEAEIAILEKYKKAKEQLEPYFGDRTNIQLAGLFGARDYDSLDSDLEKLIADLRALGEEGARAAEQIETRLGMGALNTLIKQQKALETYNSTLAAWMGKDFTTSGTGVQYKASRIAAKFNEDSLAVQEKYNKAVRQAEEAHKGDTAAIEAEIKKLQELRSAEFAYLAAKRDEDIAGLAQQAFDESTAGLNLQEWAHKSIGELKNIKDQLDHLELPAWVHEIFQYNPEGFQKFVEAFQKLIDATQEKSDTLIDEETYKNFQKYAGMASTFADSLTKLGEAAGSPELQAMGETLSFVTNTASSVMERLSKGDTTGAIIAGVTSVVTHIVDAVSATLAFENALAAVREEARRMGMSDALKEGVDNVFGSNDLAKVRNANKVFEEIQKNKNKLGATPNIRYKKGFWDYVTFGLAHHNGSIAELAQQMGMDLYDAYGNLNAEMLQKILDTYKGLGKEEKDWIQAAINDSEAYAEAMEQLHGVVESVYGDVASSATDKIVESWKERRDAALDYADVLDDVATKYAKMMIESAMLDTVLDDKKAKQLVNMFAQGQTEAAMETIANDMATIQAMAPVWEQILETFDPYFNRTSTGEGATLKDGINKELVEGNSSLIASYMNAMRADLSVIRMFQAAGWQDVRLIRESTPSLVEYTAQIAANTFDSAQASNAILSKLQSIITPSTNGGSAVRTTK